MEPLTRLIARCLLPALLLGCVAPVAARAQDAIVIACTPDGCLYHRADSNAQRTGLRQDVAAVESGNAPTQAKARTVKLASLPGLYRQPDSGLLRVLNRDGALGNLVFPSKLPRGVAAGSPASLQWAIEFRQQPASKTPLSVAREQVVAVIRGPKIEGALVDWLKREVRAASPHPLQKQIIAGGLAFAEPSEDLRLWRDALQSTMRSSLDLDRHRGRGPGPHGGHAGRRRGRDANLPVDCPRCTRRHDSDGVARRAPKADRAIRNRRRARTRRHARRVSGEAGSDRPRPLVSTRVAPEGGAGPGGQRPSTLRTRSGTVESRSACGGVRRSAAGGQPGSVQRRDERVLLSCPGRAGAEEHGAGTAGVRQGESDHPAADRS